jgi:virginiamycin B lyase
MIVTEYEVGPGAYGVALGADGAVWTSLTGRGELARVGPDGQVSRVSLDSAQSRPMVLARGPDDALWCALNQADAIARITADGGITTFPLPTAGAAPVGIDAGPEAVWVAEIGAGQVARLSRTGARRSSRCQTARAGRTRSQPPRTGAAGRPCGPPALPSGSTATAA